MKTKNEIQEIIINVTGYNTTVSTLKGSMKDYVRFKVKGLNRLNSVDAGIIREQIGVNALSSKCLIDWYSVDVKKDLIAK